MRQKLRQVIEITELWQSKLIIGIYNTNYEGKALISINKCNEISKDFKEIDKIALWYIIAYVDSHMWIYFAFHYSARVLRTSTQNSNFIKFSVHNRSAIISTGVHVD